MTAVTMTTTAGPVRRTDDDGWEHDAWTCVLEFEGRTMRVPWRAGTGHAGRAPTVADVLECVCSDAATVDQVGGFEEWAGEYGFDIDSRKAERTYRAVVEQTEQLRTLFGDQFEGLVYAEGVE